MEIHFHRPYITEDEVEAAVNSIRSGWLTMGKKTIEFEKSVSDYLNVPHAIALNSCTSALHLALKVIGIKPGEEVIIPSMTFIATANVVLHEGAKPVIIDIDKDTHQIDVNKIEENISDKTRAIIPVHYAGQPCEMDRILEIAKKYNLYVISDAAHAFPATYQGQMIGTIGDITCYSFYATKTITTGEGGMAVMNNTEWAEKMKILRLHGINKDAWNRYSFDGKWQYDVTEVGYKYNTTDINSSIGLAQMGKIDFMWKRREKIAVKYQDAFRDFEELIPYKIRNDNQPSWHLFPLRLNLEALKINRDQFIDLFKERGVGTGVHFIPIYKFTLLKNLVDNYNFDNTDWVFERIISLPIYPGLSDKEVDYIINCTVDLVKENRR